VQKEESNVFWKIFLARERGFSYTDSWNDVAGPSGELWPDSVVGDEYGIHTSCVDAEGKVKTNMSLEAIEKVTQAENRNQERKAAAEAEARQIVADAERDGLALLQQVRIDAVESGKQRMHQAEENAVRRAEEIARQSEAACVSLRETAEKYLDEAAEFIVRRVVNH